MEPEEKPPVEKSKLVAVAIQDRPSIILITPIARYEISQGMNLTHIAPVENYESEVRKQFDILRDRALTRFYSDDYRIKVFGDSNPPTKTPQSQ